MKKIKLLMATIAILVFSNLVFAINPLTGNVDDFAKNKVKQLNNMVALTDSQKVIVEKKAHDFGMKLLNRDSTTYQAFSQQYKQEYKMAIDSILTSDQKAQLAQKQLDRRNAIRASVKSKKQALDM